MLNLATPADFIEIFGQVEALELSDLEDPSEDTIDTAKIQTALDMAYNTIMSYDSLCEIYGKLAIRRSIKRLMLDIGRYILDNLSRREDVIAAYNEAIEFLKYCVEKTSGVIDATTDELEELDLLNSATASRVSFTSGRRAFTDDSLFDYRDQKLMY